MVANDQAYEPWLDEALATYSERLYYESYHPEFLDWWWEFRVGLYQPAGWVNSTIYDFATFRPYVNAVYLRGALFLEDLREQIGDEAFFSTLRDYLERNSYSQVTREDFQESLHKHTSGDLEALWREYFTPAPAIPP